MSLPADRMPKAITERKKAGRQAHEQLRTSQRTQGLSPRKTKTLPNSKSGFKDVDEERQARHEAVEEQLRLMRANFPALLKRLEKIKDVRNPKKITHKLTVLMIWGILSFVYQMSSRRQSNRKLTRPMFLNNLKELFPELEQAPHHDTLCRLLINIEVDQIEDALVDLIRRLIRKKKFARWLIENSYPVAIDGTQKHVRSDLLDPSWQKRKVGGEEKKQYYVYVLEASLAFHNGMVIPLLSEFLDYTQGDTSRDKQDCELKAFYRLAERLKDLFPRLSILVLLDGLYAKGPVMALCRRYNWQFMIVLKDDSLPSVWEEVNGLRQLQDKNRLERPWGERQQRFWWVNHIDYRYGDNRRKHIKVHVVVCEESWQEIDKSTNEVVEKEARHVWLSRTPFNKRSVHERCNLGARHRWGIEEEILAEKHHGYHYEHLFSHNWNAMRGYHYLMRIAHAFNVLAQHSSALIKMVQKLGVRDFFEFVRETMSGPWLNSTRLRAALAAPYQLRLE